MEDTDLSINRVRLRMIRQDDLAHVRQIQNSTLEMKYSKRFYERLIRDDTRIGVVAVYDETRIVAALTARLETRWSWTRIFSFGTQRQYDDRYAYVMTIAVVPEWRR